MKPNCALWAVDLTGSKRLLARSAGRLALQDDGPAGELLVTEGRVRLGMGLGTTGGEADRDLSGFDATVVSDVSRDGKTVLFAEQGSGGTVGNYSVYMRGTDGSPAMRLGEGTAGPLSPDGRWAVAIVPSTPPSLTLLPTGPGKTKTLERGPIAAYHAVVAVLLGLRGLARWFMARLGGYSGDCLGATQQLTELLCLAGLAAVAGDGAPLR